MRPAERVHAALNHEIPDCVPIHAVAIDGGMVNEILGAPQKTPFDVMAQFRQEDPANWTDRFNQMIGDLESSIFGRMLEAAANLGFDACGCGYIPFHFESEETMTDVFGRKYNVVNNKGNIFPMYVEGLIRGREDWEKWPPVDVQDICRKAARLYKSVTRRVKESIFVIAQDDYTSVFPPVWQGMGMPAFARALRNDPQLIRERFDVTLDLVTRLFRTYYDAGARVFFEGGDIAFKAGPLINPKYIDQYVKPCFQRLTAEIHGWGGDAKIIFHSDGDITSLLDFVVNSGFDGLHCLEPPYVKLDLVKKRVGDKLCLLGNIDTSHVLVKGTRVEVVNAVKNAIKNLAPTGGYILSPSNDHPTIALQNMRWMIAAARMWGKYPLSSELS